MSYLGLRFICVVDPKTTTENIRILNGYRDHSGRIEIGAVTLGQDVFVGERSVIDINTPMGDGAQLGHASALHAGQSVPAGERWHSCPGQRTEVNCLRVAPARCGTLRRAGYSGAALLAKEM